MEQRTWSLLEILEETSLFFASKGIENARLQAELLLADVLQVRRLDLYLQFERVLETIEVDAYREYVKKRLQRMPLQYITGEAAFRHLIFAVSSGVLIPRPETEILVAAALDYSTGLEAPRLLDLGCGAGAIAVSLAHEHNTARIVATDIAPQALATTRHNAGHNGVDQRLALVCGDLFEPLRRQPENRRFAAIVSNPPYVCSARMAYLEPEVRDYEPHLALDGGTDGLVYYRRIAVQAADFLEPAGLLLLEVGDTQADEVAGLLRDSGCFEVLEIRADLNDVPRVVVSRNLMGQNG